MTSLKNWWMVVLLGAVLMATLVGVAAARPNDRPAAAVTRRITVPAAFFNPWADGADWFNDGGYIESSKNESGQWFFAPVVFPTGQSVVVESITLYAYDYNPTWDILVYLMKTDPTAGDENVMTSARTNSSSTADPRSFTSGLMYSNPVKHGSGVYLVLETEDDTNLRAYGVRIQYHHGTT
jgi:hypothetical protein